MIIEGKVGNAKSLEIKRSGREGLELIIYTAGENTVKSIIVDIKDLLMCLEDFTTNKVGDKTW